MIRAAFWPAYWVTLRPYLFFVSGAAGLVGLAIPSALARPILAVAFAAFFVSYGLGQALTDVFQLDTDSISSPYRPLVRGDVSRWGVLVASAVGLAACGLVFFLINRATIALSCAAVAGLATYTPLKRRWWAGPLWNSAVVALLPAIGMECGGGSLVDARLLFAALSVLCSYAVFVILGYFKDVEADRATGYVTLPVRFGRKPAVLVSAVFLAAAVASSLALLLRSRPALGGGGLLGAALLCLGVVWLAGAHLAMSGTSSDDEAHGPIALAVRGFVAWHLGEAALLRHDLALPAVALVLLFEAALARRPCERQI